MNKNECFYFGKIIKTHGIQGELSIRIDADRPALYANQKVMFLDLSGKLIPFMVKKLSIQTDKGFVLFEDVDTLDKALKLSGKEIYLPLDQLPKLKGNKFYFHEVQQFMLIDEKFGPVGPIERVIEYPGQAVFQVFHQGKEVLIPMHDQILVKVDRRKKTIRVNAPEGLIEMYLQG